MKKAGSRRFCVNGPEVVSTLNSVHYQLVELFDLILTDVSMPVIGSIVPVRQALKKIRLL